MATKLIREYVDVRPNLKLPETLQDKLRMKRLNKKIYQLFVDYFTSIGEAELADDLIREAKLRVAKKEIKDGIVKLEKEEVKTGNPPEAVLEAAGEAIVELVEAAVPAT